MARRSAIRHFSLSSEFRAMKEDSTKMKASANPSLIGGERRFDDIAQIAKLLERQGRVYLRVHGSSMLPWVRPGDVALIRCAAIDEMRCGDVVLFKRESRLF